MHHKTDEKLNPISFQPRLRRGLRLALHCFPPRSHRRPRHSVRRRASSSNSTPRCSCGIEVEAALGQGLWTIMDTTASGYVGHAVQIYVPDTSSDLWKIRMTFLSFCQSNRIASSAVRRRATTAAAPVRGNDGDSCTKDAPQRPSYHRLKGV